MSSSQPNILQNIKTRSAYLDGIPQRERHYSPVLTGLSSAIIFRILHLYWLCEGQHGARKVHEGVAELAQQAILVVQEVFFADVSADLVGRWRRRPVYRGVRVCGADGATQPCTRAAQRPTTTSLLLAPVGLALLRPVPHPLGGYFDQLESHQARDEGGGGRQRRDNIASNLCSKMQKHHKSVH